MLRSRAFCFTINNETLDDIELLMSIPVRYMLLGFERGKQTGTPHIQGYLYLDNQIEKNVLKKKYMPRAHVEIAKGTPQQNYDYCSKELEYFEFGELPHQGRALWDRIEEAMTNPKDNIALYQQYKKSYKEVIAKDKKDQKRQVFAINTKYKYTEAKQYGDDSIVFMDPDIDTYDNQRIMFISYYTSFRLEDWYNGYSPVLRRGYELIKIDPEIVYIVCDTEDEYYGVVKKYSNIEIEYGRRHNETS